MEDQALFSIIIPTYNRAELLRRAIKSVEAQEVLDWELLVIDDGSTDHTRELVRSFNDQRIKYFFQTNKERSAARNLGIHHAKGQYFCFLDDDDYFLSNHLSALKKEVTKKGFPVAVFRTGMISKYDHKEIREPFYESALSPHPIPFFLKNMVGIHTLCYHHAILKKYTYDERWMHFQDTHLLIRCLLDFPLFQINQHTAVYMRYQEMGSLNIFRLENAAERTENNVNAIKDLFDQGGERLLNFVPNYLEHYLVSKKYLDHANGALYVGRRKLARQNFWKSFQSNKGNVLYIAYLKFWLRYLISFFR